MPLNYSFKTEFLPFKYKVTHLKSPYVEIKDFTPVQFGFGFDYDLFDLRMRDFFEIIEKWNLQQPDSWRYELILK